MSNLGWYQWITTASKKVGGPLNLLAIIGGTCLAAGTAVGSVVTNKYRNHKEKKLKDFGTYTVEKDAEDKKAELKLTYGDRVTIYAIDGESILITKNGDNEKAYFVSSDFLKDCTDYIEK